MRDEVYEAEYGLLGFHREIPEASVKTVLDRLKAGKGSYAIENMWKYFQKFPVEKGSPSTKLWNGMWDLIEQSWRDQEAALFRSTTWAPYRVYKVSYDSAGGDRTRETLEWGDVMDWFHKMRTSPPHSLRAAMSAHLYLGACVLCAGTLRVTPAFARAGSPRWKLWFNTSEYRNDAQALIQETGPNGTGVNAAFLDVLGICYTCRDRCGCGWVADHMSHVNARATLAELKASGICMECNAGAIVNQPPPKLGRRELAVLKTKFKLA